MTASNQTGPTRAASLPPTPAQTIGPFWHTLADPALADLTRLGAAGLRIQLAGRIVDGEGAAVPDACVEIWQATPAASPAFPGWGRCATDPRGEFRFTTLAPDPAAPYLAVAILARGLTRALWTRVYLAPDGDAASLAADPLLAALPPARRATLVARPEAGGWRWDVRLQGDGETVVLEYV